MSWAGYWHVLDRVAGKLRSLPGLPRRDPALVVFAAVMAAALVVGLGGVSSEWLYGGSGRIGAQKSIQARNYLEFGYIATRLAPLDNAGPARDAAGRPAAQQKDWSHPPGFPLLLSLVFALVGPSETAARLFAAALSLAALLMLIYIFRRAWGDGEAILACVFLTFMPIYAAYINLAGLDTLVLFSTMGVIFSCECYCQKRTWRRLIPLACFTLVGAFSDYSFYLFAVFFWPVLFAVEIRQVKLEGWKAPTVFTVVLLASGALAFLQLRGMQPSLAQLTGLLQSWRASAAHVPSLEVLQRWGYYIGFVSPVVILLTAYWILDLLVRVFLLKVRRADGYVLVLAAAALTAWLLSPQAAMQDDRAALHFAIPLALAAGRGFWRFATSVSYGSVRLRIALATIVALFFVFTSIPRIYARRVSPLYEFTAALHQIDSPKNFNLDLSMNIMARFMGERMGPGEKLAASEGLDLGPQFDFYLGHVSQSFRDRLDLIRQARTKGSSFIFTSQQSVWSDFLTYLLRSHDFVFYDRYYGFDTKKKMKRTVFLERVFKKVWPLGRYLRFPCAPAYSVREDPWRCLDFALKVRGRDEAGKLWKKIGGAKPETLEAAAAAYNYELSQGGSPDLKKVKAWLSAPARRKTAYGSMLEYLGAKLWKNPDGRTKLQMLFRASSTPEYNVKLDVKAEPLHEDKTLSGEIGARVWEVRPVIPTTMWKGGYLYILEDELQLFPGPYRLSFVASWFDSIQIINSGSNENAFTVECRMPPGDPAGSLARVTSKVMEIGAHGAAGPKSVRASLAGLPEHADLVEQDLGGDLVVHGCLIAPQGKDGWVLRFFLQNIGLEGRDLEMRVMGEGAGEGGSFEALLPLGKLVDEKGAGHIFWAGESVGKDPSKAKIRIVFGTKSIPNPLKTGSGLTDVVISDGSYGIDFPLSWLLH